MEYAPVPQAVPPSSASNLRRPMWVAMRPSRRGHAQQRYHAFIAWSADSLAGRTNLVSVRLPSNTVKAAIPSCGNAPIPAQSSQRPSNGNGASSIGLPTPLVLTRRPFCLTAEDFLFGGICESSEAPATVQFFRASHAPSSQKLID